jgi:hypothetical protein
MLPRRYFITMDKEDLKKFADDPKYIPGIYNYCDRWCERCSFTSCCMNFAIADEQFADKETRDITNKLFWEKLSETFQMTLDLLKEAAEEGGIDLDSIDIEGDEQFEINDDEKAVAHLISHMSNVYANIVDDWFNSNQYYLENKEHEQNINSALKLIKPKPTEESVPLGDTLEVIRWYQYQIHVKLLRAIKGKKMEDSMTFNDFPRDSDGSAKVALIGIDRSISAWGEMIKHFEDQEDKIMNIIAHLSSLRERTEIEFPEARAFVRPGFDEINSNG